MTFSDTLIAMLLRLLNVSHPKTSRVPRRHQIAWASLPKNSEFWRIARRCSLWARSPSIPLSPLQESIIITESKRRLNGNEELSISQYTSVILYDWDRKGSFLGKGSDKFRTCKHKVNSLAHQRHLNSRIFYLNVTTPQSFSTTIGLKRETR